MNDLVKIITTVVVKQHTYSSMGLLIAETCATLQQQYNKSHLHMMVPGVMTSPRQIHDNTSASRYDQRGPR